MILVAYFSLHHPLVSFTEVILGLGGADAREQVIAVARRLCELTLHRCIDRANPTRWENACMHQRRAVNRNLSALHSSFLRVAV